MVGKITPARSVPFFWTTIFGKSIRYAGYALEYDDVIIDKPENGFEPDTLNFVAYYAKGERIVRTNYFFLLGTSIPISKTSQFGNALSLTK